MNPKQPKQENKTTSYRKQAEVKNLTSLLDHAKS